MRGAAMDAAAVTAVTTKATARGRRPVPGFPAAVLLLLLSTTLLGPNGLSLAMDEPDELMSGTRMVVGSWRFVRLAARPISGDLPDPGNDPTIHGARLRVFDVGGDAGDDTYTLPAPGWKRLPPSSSRPLRGYRFSGDPCSVAVKRGVVRATCEGSDVTLMPPFAGSVGVILSIGSDTKRYCAQFGGRSIRNDAALTKRTGAPPAVCPAPADDTTTTSTTSSTAATVATTSTTFAPCCNGAAFHTFTVADAPGDCGDITRADGTKSADIACSGLYAGGGGNSVPLPAVVPDRGQAIEAIVACTGQLATLGPTTSAQTGSNRNCTAVGCLFGAPLAIPNAGSIPTSVCVISALATDTAGTFDCGTGEENQTIQLTSEIFLTGDGSTDPGNTIAGIQPCPLCQEGTCVGGPNDGGSCIADTTDLGDEYPTSHDCPPDPTLSIGALSIPFPFTSGSLSWRATPATNDDGTFPNQPRTFSGFCRDADATGAFADPAEPCWENGMAVGPPCGGTFETCEQRTNGAFGPNGGSIKTITAVGSPQAGVLTAPSPGTLVSVFSIPPAFNATIDAAADLPGPGAVALPGTGALCVDAMSCP